MDEETEDSADRLVIDESNEEGRRSSLVMGDNSSDGGDEVPQCQGCNQKAAQFVCAGCGNQWYCSRDCQVIHLFQQGCYEHVVQFALGLSIQD